MAVVTSGDNEKFAMVAGQRYAHLINPGTGYPIQGIRSASLVCPDAGQAMAVIVLGKQKSFHPINQLYSIL